MINYVHECRDCQHVWELSYGLNDEIPSNCPKCLSGSIFRQVTTSGSIQFKGHGWSPTGYSKFSAYEQLKAKGQTVTRYETKEEHDRERKGEAEADEMKKLKRLDEVSKRTLGPDAALTQAEADKKIKKAGKDALSTDS
jgi:putative FmdB family regulatory protein